MSNFLDNVRADLARYTSSRGWRGYLHTYFTQAGFRVTFWYRVARHASAKNRLLGKCCTFWLMRYQHQTGVQLNPGTEIGPGLFIPHFGSIIINTRSRIGKNCYLSHDVTLGKAHSGPRQGVPVLGDDVFIGPGAKILGHLTIGDNAAIGANSVVLSDIPPSCFAAGAPAKVIKQTGAREILGYEQSSPQEPPA
jgi:serine O-acetyltransferase